MYKTNPELLVIGHMCYDKTPEGYILGGAAAYSGICGLRLGKKVSIITSVDKDFKFLQQFKEAEIHNVRTEKTTVFENTYHQGHRQQYLLQKAKDLLLKDIPEIWKKSQLVFISPISNEVDPNILDGFENALICINPQGWMRRWDETGKVSTLFAEDWSILEKAHIVCLSLEDLGGDLAKIETLACHSKILIITKGKDGLTVYHDGKSFDYPAIPAHEVDPTGAGDIFAVAFLIRYSELLDIEKALLFAQAAASISIEKAGTGGIPDRKAIKERLKLYLRQ